MIKRKAKTSNGIQKKSRIKSPIRSKSPVRSKSGSGGMRTPRGRISKGHSSDFEVYVQYNNLENSTLLNILKGIEDIKKYAIANYEEISGIKVEEIARLNIRQVATGHSIILKYGGSLVPKIQLKDGDFIISIHKKVFSALLWFTSFLKFMTFFLIQELSKLTCS